MKTMNQQEAFASLAALAPAASVPRVVQNAQVGQFLPTENSFWETARVLSTVAGAYHGYRRHHGDVLYATAWALGGYVLPIIVPAIAVVQGFGEPT